jgi:hypothetical protein
MNTRDGEEKSNANFAVAIQGNAFAYQGPQPSWHIFDPTFSGMVCLPRQWSPD